MGLDALAHEWSCVLLYAFLPLELITPTLARLRETALILIGISAAGRPAMASAHVLSCTRFTKYCAHFTKLWARFTKSCALFTKTCARFTKS